MAVKYAPHTGADAVARAKSYVGKAVRVDMCQAFVCVDVFGTGAVGDYDGDKDADAVDAWKKAKGKGKVVLAPTGSAALAEFIKNIPASVQLFWTGGSHGYGHTAPSIGKGQMVTTGIPSNPKVSIRDIGYVTKTWGNGLTLVGYATVEGNGYTLTGPPVAATTAVWGKPATWKIGSTGADVTRLGERLVIWAKALGLPAPYKVGPGDPYSATDVAAVKAFQIAQGWSGKDADGYPGAETFKRLAANPPTTPVPASRTATFWGGLGNLMGGYNKTDKAWWGKRANGQAALIRSMGVSWFVALELHEDNGMAAEFVKLLPKGWKLALGRGGNQLLYDGAKYTIVSTENLWMSTGKSKRSMTKWNVEHKATGVRFWIVGAHLAAGTTLGLVRNAQAKYLIAHTNTLHRAFICVDQNNYSGYVGSPVAQFVKAGWLGLRAKVKSLAPIANAAYNSHQPGSKGQWIDEIRSRDLVTILEAEQVLTGSSAGNLSDHNWQKCKASIEQEVAS